KYFKLVLDLNFMEQEEIWNAISQPWAEFRLNPIDEVVDFLRDKKGKILDLGCGNGKHFSSMNGEIYGIDFSENMLKFAKQIAEKNKLNVNLTKTFAHSLPFKDNFFDAAIFVAVLHCIPDAKKREKALKELFRVLRPGAEAFITVWDKNQERFKNSGKESFVPWTYNEKKYMRYYYLYDTQEFLDLLKETGFEIVQLNNSTNPNGFYSKKNIDVIVRKPIS
ncbi:MAG: class I SAM-dependent methyltransferase, partial [Nanoarchaeota archaeon]